MHGVNCGSVSGHVHIVVQVVRCKSLGVIIDSLTYSVLSKCYIADVWCIILHSGTKGNYCSGQRFL